MSFHYEHREPITPFSNTLALTDDELRQAQWEVDEDRKKFQRDIRHKGGVKTAEDYEMQDRMDNWAMKVFTEMLRRAEERRKKLNLDSADKQSVHLGDKESLSSSSNPSTSTK